MNNPAPQWHIQVLTVFFATLFGLCVYETLGSTFMLRKACAPGMQAHHSIDAGCHEAI